MSILQGKIQGKCIIHLKLSFITLKPAGSEAFSTEESELFSGEEIAFWMCDYFIWGEFSCFRPVEFRWELRVTERILDDMGFGENKTLTHSLLLVSSEK
jgi:hypothetical protein